MKPAQQKRLYTVLIGFLQLAVRMSVELVSMKSVK